MFVGDILVWFIIAFFLQRKAPRRGILLRRDRNFLRVMGKPHCLYTTRRIISTATRAPFRCWLALIPMVLWKHLLAWNLYISGRLKRRHICESHCVQRYAAGKQLQCAHSVVVCRVGLWQDVISSGGVSFSSLWGDPCNSYFNCKSQPRSSQYLVWLFSKKCLAGPLAESGIVYVLYPRLGFGWLDILLKIKEAFRVLEKSFN